MIYKRITILEPADVGRDDLMTIMEAARDLQVAQSTVSIRARAGKMTIYVDEDAGARQGRILLLKSEVGDWKMNRQM